MKNSAFVAWISLFASTGTLFCCALPSLLVALGMGATMAGLVSAVPQLIWLSQYKILVFGLSAIMLIVAGLLQYKSRNAPCPTDIKKAKACATSRTWSLRVYLLSDALWLTGAFFAFVAPHVF